MRTIIPSLPFLAFPSEKVLAEFRPVRGLLIEMPAPKADPSGPADIFHSLGELLNAALPDPRPLIEAIADEMGYDADLLAAGEGETGVPGHSWVTYGDETLLPMLVRWQAGDAQLLLTLVATSDRGEICDLRLTILGDEAARPLLRRLVVALTPFHLTRPSNCHGLVEVDGQSRRMGLPEIAFARFGATVSVWGNTEGQISPERMTELAEIARSCNLSSTRLDHDDPFSADDLRIWLRQSGEKPIACPYGRSLAAELIELIQRQSVKDVRRLTTTDLGRHFGPPLGFGPLTSARCRVEEQSPAVIGQRLHLAGILHEIDHLPLGDDHRLFSRPFGTYRLAMGNTSIGLEFRRPDDEVLVGIGHRTYGAEHSTGYDLLTLGIMAVEGALKQIEETLDASGQSFLQKEGQELSALSDLRLNPGSPRTWLMPIEKPGYGIHLGLPVRVDRSAVVWRKDDVQALAIDFHHSAAGTHLARIRRCPVPVKKA